MKIDDSQFDPTIDAREREYTLRGKVWVIRDYVKQGAIKGKEEIKAVCIALQESDETTRFFDAWLPESENHQSEVLCSMGHPIYGSCRMAVQRASRNYPYGPHLFVMHKWAEDILVNKPFEVIEFVAKRGLEDAQDTHESDKRDVSTSSVDRI